MGKRHSRSKSAAQASETEAMAPQKAQATDFAGRCVAVLGDGASALASVSAYAAAGWHVTWIAGGGARVLSPLPTLNQGEGALALCWLARKLGVETAVPHRGSFLREFRNKSFREPAWVKSGDIAERAADIKDGVWIPEARFMPLEEVRLGDRSLADIELELRARVLELPNVVRYEGMPVEGLLQESVSERWSVRFGSGEKIQADRVIYADRWSKLAGLEGLPKPVPFARGRNPSGLLQAVFRHNRPVGMAGMECGFIGALHKEAGEDTARNMLGYFFEGGRRSVWTTFFEQDEVEDNHLIGKKLRRMKQALEKLFVGPEWCGEGVETILSTIESEHVAFEESTVCHSGQVPEKFTVLATLPGVLFLTDGYGPTCAWSQAVDLIRRELGAWAEQEKFLEFEAESELEASSENPAEDLMESAAELNLMQQEQATVSELPS
jgi:hypothetical protein